MWMKISTFVLRSLKTLSNARLCIIYPSRCLMSMWKSKLKAVDFLRGDSIWRGNTSPSAAHLSSCQAFSKALLTISYTNSVLQAPLTLIFLKIYCPLADVERQLWWQPFTEFTCDNNSFILSVLHSLRFQIACNLMLFFLVGSETVHTASWGIIICTKTIFLSILIRSRNFISSPTQPGLIYRPTVNKFLFRVLRMAKNEAFLLYWPESLTLSS